MKDKGFRSGFLAAVFMFVGIAVVAFVGKSALPSVGEAFVLESVSDFSEEVSSGSEPIISDSGGSTSAVSSDVSSPPESVTSSVSSSTAPVEASSGSALSSAPSSAPPESTVNSSSASISTEPVTSTESSVSSSEPPATVPESTPQTSEPVPSPPESVSGLININTASAHELQMLNGIGEVKARAIIEYREQNGGFSSVDELINVKGIGEKTLEKIRADVTV